MSHQSQNSNTPRFRHRTGFAAVSNDVIRDTSLSLKAKGLFALIQSYITNESLIVTKAFLQEKCTEGEAAFENAWKELKKAGYLIQEKCKAENGKFLYLYDLVNELPFPAKSDHTPKNHPMENHTVDSHPIENHPDGNPSHGKEGAYIKLDNKTDSKNQSINPIICNVSKDNTDEEDMQYLVESELDKTKAIPEHYFGSQEKLSAAIHYLTSFDQMTCAYFDNDQSRYNAFQLIVTCLTEMSSEQRPMKYNSSHVPNGIKVIQQINTCIRENGKLPDSVYGSLCSFIDHTLDDFEAATKSTEIRDIHSYIKAVIWTSLISHKVKFDAFFSRTQNEWYSNQQ